MVLCTSLSLTEAYHIPGSSSIQADLLSRKYNQNLEWILHPIVFEWVSQSLCVPNIDLFASCLNFQTSTYFSWLPNPGGNSSFIFPPIQFVRQNRNEAQSGGSLRCSNHSTLVTNCTLLPTASPIILLLVQRPILLPQWDKLLPLPLEDILPPLKVVMRLAAWIVFGITSRSEEFL